MEQQAEAPPGFCARPPSCLVLLGDEIIDSDKVERVFNDEARNVQSRLREQLSQLRIELGLFLRLMYKNKNQHRRSLYYRRLSEMGTFEPVNMTNLPSLLFGTSLSCWDGMCTDVHFNLLFRQVRRNLQMLSTAGLDETVENFAKFFSAMRPDGVSSKAVSQSKFKDVIDERKSMRILLSVARLLNQSDGPIMASSAQLAGLLGQSFFMPFALTMFSCLARFRVLLIQILYEVVTAFNLLAAVWQKSEKSLIYSAQGKSVSTSALGRSLPLELECHWDGGKLSMTEKKPANVTENRGTLSDGPVEPSRLWFVDDRTGVKHDLEVPPISAGPSGEQLCVNSQVTVDANKSRFMISTTVEKTSSVGPNLEVRPHICRRDPGEEDIARPSAEDFTAAKEIDDRVQDVSASNPGPDLLAMSSVTQSRESAGHGQVSAINRDYRHVSGTAVVKKTVAYRSISHKIVLDSKWTSGNIVQNMQLGAKKNGAADTGVDEDVKHKALKGSGSHEITRVSGDKGNNALPDSCNLVEDKAPSIIPTIPPLSCSSRNVEMVKESGSSNRVLREVEFSHENSNATIRKTAVSQQNDSGEVDAAAATGTSGSVMKAEVKDTLTASVDTVAAIEDTGSQSRPAMEHNKAGSLGPECTEVYLPNKALTRTSQNDNTIRYKPVDSEVLNVNHISREVSEGEGGVDQNGIGGDFAVTRPLFPCLSETTIEDAAASHSLREKVEIAMERNHCGGDAAALETYGYKDGPQTAGSDGPIIAQPSLFLIPESFELQKAGPGPSELTNALWDSSRLSGKDSALKTSEPSISANPGLTSHSNGKEDKRTGAVDNCGDCLTSLPKKADLVQVTSEQTLGNNISASTCNNLKTAKIEKNMPVAYASMRSGLKASQIKRENDANRQPQSGGIIRSEKRPELLSGLHQKSPRKSKLKRCQVDSKERSSESESKRKKTNDIFAMLIGGSD